MGKSLVLAEKPSVAKDIARVLGCRQNKQNKKEGNFALAAELAKWMESQD